jgi:hypothetical protein
MTTTQMKKAIANSPAIYIVKGYYDEFTSLYTLHIADDDCNEYTVYLYSTHLYRKGDASPDKFEDAIVRPYNRTYWSNLEQDACHYKHTKIA